MTRFRCLSCGGEYNDVSEDGVRYFHACSPTVYDFSAVVPPGQPFPEKPRPDRRDENVDAQRSVAIATGAPGGALFRTETSAPVKAEGKGRERV